MSETVGLYIRVDKELLPELEQGARDYNPPLSRAKFTGYIIRLGLEAHRKRTTPDAPRKRARG